ncbi:hypothetical protein H17ap60334_07993 [Thermosipho africanus H17ap60334]|jgi:peptidoglycan hydrolase CwlO-like protein|uniref:Uncharacterized protein n=1 Tax=Thermosipho africanus (strain TCF52B) TaxID=484019 RepID=B7IEL7_THEAB|nr:MULTISPECIES: hypothetical protein [Thermosipho]HCF38648.1 hypothetical protein [Thermosipho africanus]ACJ74531.1 hypothetical protein THA_23 [Thermosipho africanus TCF52B]EKF49071.1 hypothetical protein H17ap60334_07993 [Thermosipho africanus H17ap60334]MBZ4649689.1 hypothetical protein [Thermosipho sp. (in: thermotogales)]MDK2839226.1 hypothetical protein [Thermosipho sp. (in: thermotogales)]
MAISVQAKRSRVEKLSKLSVLELLKKFFLVAIPALLIFTMVYVVVHFSTLNVEIQTQKEAYQRELVELNTKLINLNKSIESLTIGLENIR